MRIANIVNALNPRAPRGLVLSAADWVREHATPASQLRRPQARAWMEEVFPAESNFNQLAYEYERTAGDEFDRVRWTTTPAATLFYAQGCRVLGLEGAVISPENRVFADFTLPPAEAWLDHSCFRRRLVPKAVPLKGWYATLAWPESSFFFHWMVEALPRMAVLGRHVARLDGLFVPGPVTRFHRESLEALGVPASKLIPLDAGSHYAPEHLFVPRAFSMYNPPRWTHRWFKAAYGLADEPATGNSKRIYISRSDAPARRVSNEAEVIALLSTFGFEVLRLSDLPFMGQARAFNAADVIVAPHGAGLSHLVFCRENTTVVDMMPPRWMAPCFMTLALSAGLRYHHLVGIEEPGPDPQRNDIALPVAELETLLRRVLA